jgi:ribosomal protein S18 acetylase RimI-like enzyme
MAPDVRIELGDARLAAGRREEICLLHHEVFSSSPFVTTVTSPREHEAVLDAYMRSPEFSVSLALREDRLLGFAYGHRLPVDHGWWEGFPSGVEDEVSAEWEGRTCTLVDLAVERPSRRSGIGSRLVDELLSSRGEERALLSVQPTADAAQRFYTSTGWDLVGRKGPIPGVTPPHWDIYLRALRGHR